MAVKYIYISSYVASRKIQQIWGFVGSKHEM